MELLIVFHFTFIALCIMGFVFQVYNIGNNYFKYLTATTTDIKMPLKLRTPAVSLCVRYGDVIKGKDGKWTYTMNDTERMEHLLHLQTTMTLKNIFEMTPPTENLLTSCLQRKQGSYRAIEYNASECGPLFKISKYFIMEFICYRFEPFDWTPQDSPFYSYQNIAFSLGFAGLFYGLVLNYDSMEGINFFKIVAHSSDNMPYDSLAFAPTLYRIADGEPKYNNIKIVYSFLKIQLLPPPYVTNCRVYKSEGSGGGKKVCIDECIKKGLNELNGKLPFNKIENMTLDQEIVTDLDLENDTFVHQLQEIEDDCTKVCVQPACKKRFYLGVLEKEESSGEQKFTLQVNAPNLPLFSVRHRELITASGFFVYISSCFGIWFGLSVLSFRPNTLWQEVNNLLGRETKKECRYCDPVNQFLKQEIALLRTRMLTRRLMNQPIS